MTNINRAENETPSGRTDAGGRRFRREAAVLFPVFICLLVFSGVFYATRKGGAEAVISVNGEEYGTYSLAVEKEIAIEGAEGQENVIAISGGKVFMKSASCKNQICVRTGKISKAGQSIVCLPNRVTVTIRGGAETDYDSMTK